jgi:hypothetical protein
VLAVEKLGTLVCLVWCLQGPSDKKNMHKQPCSAITAVQLTASQAPSAVPADVACGMQVASPVTHHTPQRLTPSCAAAAAYQAVKTVLNYLSETNGELHFFLHNYVGISARRSCCACCQPLA